VTGLIPAQINVMWTLQEYCEDFKINFTANDQKTDHIQRKRLLAWTHEKRAG